MIVLILLERIFILSILVLSFNMEQFRKHALQSLGLNPVPVICSFCGGNTTTSYHPLHLTDPVETDFLYAIGQSDGHLCHDCCTFARVNISPSWIKIAATIARIQEVAVPKSLWWVPSPEVLPKAK